MRGEIPGEVDRYNLRRYLSLTSNIEHEDLGRVIEQLDKAIASVGQPPRGVEVDLRGQVRPMKEMFQSLEIGLGVAVVVIMIMLTGYFQSPRLALSAVVSVPAVLTGVVLALRVTGTTLNIESFMGAIMAVGVAVSNAIMLVSFADRHRREEGMTADRAAITAAKGRLRPIIMTGSAMIAGMIPMSLGLEEGSEQNAPLGRAVIGGMALATFATLLVLPASFTLLLGGASATSPSLDPDDPQSTHYDPIHPQHPKADDHAAGPDGGPETRATVCTRKTTMTTKTSRGGSFPAASPSPGDPAPCRPRRLNRASSTRDGFSRSTAPGGVRLGNCAFERGLRFFPAAGAALLRAEAATRPRPRAMPATEPTKGGDTAGISVVHPQRRDIRMMVIQPGTVQAYETTPIYARIAGYVQKYNYNIGDRVKAGDVLLDMWIPDYVERLGQLSAAVKRAEVQIRVTESALRPRRPRSRQPRQGQLGRGRSQACPGRLHPLGVRIQASGAARRPARARRPGSRRDLSPVRGSHRTSRPGKCHGFRSELVTRLKPSPTATGHASMSRPPALIFWSPRRTSAKPECNVEYGQIKAPYDGVITAQRQPRRLPSARRRHQRPAALHPRADRPGPRLRRRP